MDKGLIMRLAGYALLLFLLFLSALAIGYQHDESFLLNAILAAIATIGAVVLAALGFLAIWLIER